MTKAVRVTNNSVVDCAFSWSFLEDVDEGRMSATARRPYIPVNQIFDILPIRSFLRPGESEEVRAWDLFDLHVFETQEQRCLADEPNILSFLLVGKEVPTTGEP